MGDEQEIDTGKREDLTIKVAAPNEKRASKGGPMFCRRYG